MYVLPEPKDRSCAHLQCSHGRGYVGAHIRRVTERAEGDPPLMWSDLQEQTLGQGKGITRVSVSPSADTSSYEQSRWVAPLARRSLLASPSMIGKPCFRRTAVRRRRCAQETLSRLWHLRA